jgi:hypothetical protein
MLIDDLLNCRQWKEAKIIDHLRSRLIKAPKFIMRADFAMAVDEVVHTNWDKNYPKMVPLARIPYRECWFETSQSERTAYRAAADIRPYEVRVKRIGYLLTEIETGGKWVANMFWSFDQKDPRIQQIKAETDPDFWASAPYSAAMASISFDPQCPIAFDAVEPYGPSEFALGVVQAGGTGLHEINFKGTLTDWTGEGSFLVATLALLNSKNVVESTPVSFEKKNKAAVKSGQLPLYDHHVLSITKRYIKRNMDLSTASDGRKFRLHFVRGHFKVRRTGVFFWHDHSRGDSKLGHVHKDYDLHK